MGYRVRRFLYLFVLLSFTTASFAQTAKPPQANGTAATASAKQAYEVPFVNKTLPNGLEVIVLPDSGVPLVTVELAVRNGSFTEPPELNGLSHLYEHMFFKTNKAVVAYQCETFSGTSPVCGSVRPLLPQIGDVRYIANLGNMGITYNGTTREEVVNYYYTTTSPYLETAIHAISDSVRFPLFDEKEFEDEKRVVVGEIDRNESNPFFYLSREMSDKLFYKYPTRKNPLGTRESVLSATTDKMRTIQSRYYVPNNAALVVTGDVKPEQVFGLAEKIMGSWEKRTVDPFKEFPLVEHPPLAKSEAIVIDKNIGTEEQSLDQNVLINIGWQGPSIGKDDKGTYAADVFSYIITQPDSRFQRNLVDSGLASAVSFGYYTQRNVGPINLFIVTTPDKAKAALKAAYAEIAQFNQPGYFTDEELESSKTTLEANDLFEREKLSEYAHTLSFWWSSTGIEYFRGYQRNLRATSRPDINNYITTYIQVKPHVAIALLAPEVKVKANLTDEDLIGGK